MDKNLSQSHHSRIYDNFLMHWKYIKREKVNGKWQYTYKDDKDDKHNLSTARGRVDNAKDTVNRQQQRYDYVMDKVKTGEFFDKDNGNYSIPVDEHKDLMDAKRELSSAERNLKKAKEAYSKTPSAKIEATKEKIENAKKSIGNKIEDAVDSAVDRVNDTANKIEDKLGVDERNKYKLAEAKYNNAVSKSNEASRRAKNAIAEYYDDELPSKYEQEELHDSVDSSTHWKEVAYKRGEEYMTAKSEYMKTPLGTALKVTEAVKDIPFEVEYALKKLMKKKK